MNQMRSAPRLQAVLRLNAGITAACGVALAVLAGPIDDILGTARPGIVRLTGIGLAVFAVDVVLISRARSKALVIGGALVAAADVAWVAGSVATVAAGWYRGMGDVLVMGAAAVVAAFAVAEIAALRGTDRQSINTGSMLGV